MPNKILIVDDEIEIAGVLDELLTIEGFQVQKASSGKEATEILKNYGTELVLTDIRMPGMDGLELLDWIKKKDPEIEVIIMTGHASVETAVNALKKGGAFNYFTKPFEDIDELVISIKNALEKRALKIENNLLIQKLKFQNTELEHNVKKRTAELEQEVIERKKVNADLQETSNQLVQSEKMSALGEFSATVAHER